MLPFTAAKQEFDKLHEFADQTPHIVPVDGKHGGVATIKGAAGKPNEEYYKWQFISALINGGMYAKDYTSGMTKQRTRKGRPVKSATFHCTCRIRTSYCHRSLSSKPVFIVHRRTTDPSAGSMI